MRTDALRDSVVILDPGSERRRAELDSRAHRLDPVQHVRRDLHNLHQAALVRTQSVEKRVDSGLHQGEDWRWLEDRAAQSRQGSMSGLSVIYAKKATEEQEWASIPNRDRTGRLREVYWARHAESKIGPKSLGPKPFSSMRLEWRADRSVIGRARDDPGDMFTRLLHKSRDVVVTQAPAFRVARAWRRSRSSLALLFIDRIHLRAGRMMRPAR